MSINIHACRLPDELSPELEQGWRALEDRAIEASAYHSPDFVIPAARHLDPELDIVAILVEKVDGGDRRIIAAGVFNEAMHGRFPRRRIVRSYLSTHSYLSGVLVDKKHTEQGLAALYSAIFETFPRASLCEFKSRPADSGVTAAESAACRSAGVHWQHCHSERRPVLELDGAGEGYIETRFSKSTRKGVARKKRQLDGLGGFRWQLTASVDAESIETFLRLEHTGWKKEEGYSMLSRGSQADFFREMATRFARRDKLRFAEIFVGDRCIACNVNLLSGDLGFAFKLAWDAEFHHYSPGMINEVELIRHAPAELPKVRFLESGALEGSFMDRLWKDSRELESGFLCRDGLTYLSFCTEFHAKRVVRKLLRPLLPQRRARKH